jgi:hypothetical protein
MRPSLLHGRCIFAVGLAGLAVLGFVYQDFIIGRPLAWPYINNLNPGLAYVSNAIVILAAIAIFAKQKGKTAAFVIGGLMPVSFAQQAPGQFDAGLVEYLQNACTNRRKSDRRSLV